MASKRRLRRKACEGKIRHATREAALGGMRSMQRSPKCIGGSALGVYQCRHCHGWHVGHAPGSGFLLTAHLRRAANCP